LLSSAAAAADVTGPAAEAAVASSMFSHARRAGRVATNTSSRPALTFTFICHNSTVRGLYCRASFDHVWKVQTGRQSTQRFSSMALMQARPLTTGRRPASWAPLRRWDLLACRSDATGEGGAPRYVSGV